MNAPTPRQPGVSVSSSRWLSFTAGALATILAAACSEPVSGPPSIKTEQREAIKLNLTRLGAKITSEEPSGLYASLRNTHVQLLKLGGVVEGLRRSRQDLQDFGLVNEAVAKGFLESDELPEFQRWLRSALSEASPSANRAEYARYQLSVSREPLRMVFSQRSPRAAEPSHE